jgi:Matrixin
MAFPRTRSTGRSSSGRRASANSGAGYHLIPMAELPPPPTDTSPEPSRRAVFLALSVVFVLLGATAIAAVSATPAPVAEATSSRVPLASPTFEAGAFRFFSTHSDGTPFRWDPCGTIHFVVNPDGGPTAGVLDAKEAVQRISQASGMPWVYGGTTTVTPETQLRSFFQSPQTGQAWPPVLIAFVDRSRFSSLLATFGGGSPQHVLAFGLPTPGYEALNDRYVSGEVVVNASQHMTPGFATRYSLGVVMMHELGHVMGLAHVTDPRELMYSGPGEVPPQTNWGPGDLLGLKQVGRASSCDATTTASLTPGASP